MKSFTIYALGALIGLLSTITIVSAQTQEGTQSVLETAKPIIQEPALPTLTAPTLTAPTVVAPAPIGQLPESPLQLPAAPSVVEPMSVPALTAAPATSAACCNTCGQTCSKRRRRCCPPPVPTVFCLTDTCGCTHEACIDVPACCCGEEPCITWRKGVLGRQIATLCWECCDFEAKVIISRRGKVRVRD